LSVLKKLRAKKMKRVDTRPEISGHQAASIEEKRTGAEEGTRTSEFRQLFSPQENGDIY
jgi:hypothetical protein